VQVIFGDVLVVWVPTQIQHVADPLPPRQPKNSKKTGNLTMHNREKDIIVSAMLTTEMNPGPGQQGLVKPIM